jgi:chaperone modulatory protein CbpM
MTTKRLKEILLKLPDLNLPERSDLVAWAQMVEYTEITPDACAELMELGWIAPARTRADEYLFTLRDVYRVQKLMRICRDLEVTFGGGTIIIDLLERIETLEGELEKARRLL